MSGYVPKLTHVQRAERRRAIADFVSEGHTLGEAAARFHITAQTASHACRALGIPVRGRGRPRASGFAVLAKLLRRDRTPVEIALDMGVSRQVVAEIHRRAAEAGLIERPLRLTGAAS